MFVVLYFDDLYINLILIFKENLSMFVNNQKDLKTLESLHVFYCLVSTLDNDFVLFSYIHLNLRRS